MGRKPTKDVHFPTRITTYATPESYALMMKLAKLYPHIPMSKFGDEAFWIYGNLALKHEINGHRQPTWDPLLKEMKKFKRP